MKTSSAKQKGKRLQNLVTLKLRTLFENILEKDDIKSQTSSLNGTDVVFSPSAKHLIAFDCECKNVEKLIGSNLSDAIKQCEMNSSDERIPLLIFKKNNDIERVILRLDDFLNLIYPTNNISVSMNDIQKIVILLEQMKQKILQLNKV